MMHCGKTRRRLSALLNELLPDLIFFPEELHSQPAAYLKKEAGHARWFTTVAVKTGGVCNVACWDTMVECVRNGITAHRRGPSEIDIYAKET